MLGTRIDVATLAQTNWDLVVIGGGITGAGVLLEALRQMGQMGQTGQGKKVLLLEQKDFAWGTSSRSSKMVHGGIRYAEPLVLDFQRKIIRAMAGEN